MFYRTDYISGSEVELAKGGSGKEFVEGCGKKDRGNEEGNHDRNGNSIGENEGEGLGIGGDKGDLPGGDQGDHAKNEEADNPYEDSGVTGKERKKSGFIIKIIDNDLLYDDFNEEIRSELFGSEIRIYKRHPDFEDRLKISRQGEMKITQRLITYLAGEVTVHYKDVFHQKHGQPLYNKKMFSDLVQFVYKFESMLSELDGKKLSELEGE